LNHAEKTPQMLYIKAFAAKDSPKSINVNITALSEL